MMQDTEKYFLLKSNNKRKLVFFFTTLILLNIMLTVVYINIIVNLSLQFIYIFIEYYSTMGYFNDFYFYTRKVRVHNKLKFWSPNIVYSYDEIDKIIIDNRAARYLSTNIKFVLKDFQTKRFGYCRIDVLRIIKLIEKFEDVDFNIDFFEGRNSSMWERIRGIED